MSYNRSNNKPAPSNRSPYNLRKSTTEQRILIQERLINLRKARSELENQELFLEDLLQQLDLQDISTPESNPRVATSFSTVAEDSYQSRPRTETSSVASKQSIDEISFQTATEPPYKQDSSFQRIRGICAIPSSTVPLRFDRLGPYKVGDIAQISREGDPEFGRQGVVHKVTNCFVYFSHDRASYQRAPQNICRIHISEYIPYE